MVEGNVEFKELGQERCATFYVKVYAKQGR